MTPPDGRNRRSIPRVDRPKLPAKDAKPTKAMKVAMKRRHNGQSLAPATKKALADRGFITVRGNGRWHWTPLGRAMVREFKNSQE